MLDKTIIELALSLGFPTWAAVVWYAASRVTSIVRDLGDKLQISHADAEKRLALLETVVSRLERLAEHHEQRIHELETK